MDEQAKKRDTLDSWIHFQESMHQSVFFNEAVAGGWPRNSLMKRSIGWIAFIGSIGCWQRSCELLSVRRQIVSVRCWRRRIWRCCYELFYSQLDTLWPLYNARVKLELEFSIIQTNSIERSSPLFPSSNKHHKAVILSFRFTKSANYL